MEKIVEKIVIEKEYVDVEKIVEVEKIINKYVEVEKMVEVVDEHKQKELEKIIEDKDSQLKRME